MTATLLESTSPVTARSTPELTTSAHEHDCCTALFVTDANFLDDSPAIAGQRELLGKLTALGTPCSVVSGLLVKGEKDIEPDAWLAERGWSIEEETDTRRQA